ncbi:uncharacterized protein LOC142178053 [Nicotiana tabacum]|uniref:Uncharacterized protein LOC142178053 n=1 Tax=Nicotiana tabacum TaxID=4097 RepID=A0AC58U1V8_TOBAC
MWDKLEVTYERTSKVKETRIKLLVYDYKLFQMKEEESMEEMLGRFSKIIGDLKAFGKPYSSALEKTHLKKMRQEEKKKIVPFKTITNEPENDIDDDPEALEDEISMVSRNMNELMRRYRNTKKGKDVIQMNQIYHMMKAKKILKTISWQEVKQARNVLQDEVQELQMQLNGMHKSTNHSFVKSNQAAYKSSEKVAVRTEFTSTRSNTRSTHMCQNCNKVDINIPFVDFVNLIFQDGFGNPKTILILVELTNKDPSKLGYLKEGDNSILQEHHRKSRKGKWYLDSACSSHMKCDKNLFKEVTKINGGNVKIDDNSKKKKIAGTGRFPFNNNCDITEVYLVDGLNYYLLSISQLCDSGYEVKFKKAGCAIEDELGKIILPEKRYENVYILDGIENLDSHIGLAFISDDP